MAFLRKFQAFRMELARTISSYRMGWQFPK